MRMMSRSLRRRLASSGRKFSSIESAVGEVRRCYAPLGVSDNRNRAGADASDTSRVLHPRTDPASDRASPFQTRTGRSPCGNRVQTGPSCAFHSATTPPSAPGNRHRGRREETRKLRCTVRGGAIADVVATVGIEHRPIQCAGRESTEVQRTGARCGRNIAPFKSRQSCVSHPSPTAPLVLWRTGTVDEAWKTRCRSRLGPGRCGSRTGRQATSSEPPGRRPRKCAVFSCQKCAVFGCH